MARSRGDTLADLIEISMGTPENEPRFSIYRLVMARM